MDWNRTCWLPSACPPNGQRPATAKACGGPLLLVPSSPAPLARCSPCPLQLCRLDSGGLFAVGSLVVCLFLRCCGLCACLADASPMRRVRLANMRAGAIVIAMLALWLAAPVAPSASPLRLPVAVAAEPLSSSSSSAAAVLPEDVGTHAHTTHHTYGACHPTNGVEFWY
jgi:hypothetical protein